MKNGIAGKNHPRLQILKAMCIVYFIWVNIRDVKLSRPIQDPFETISCGLFSNFGEFSIVRLFLALYDAASNLVSFGFWLVAENEAITARCVATSRLVLESCIFTDQMRFSRWREYIRKKCDTPVGKVSGKRRGILAVHADVYAEIIMRFLHVPETEQMRNE